ncbi:MAG: hypothetical protein CFH41_01565 [Alphaproteobacteria bacterium MarineAlpha11_Bin1]|nr:MAG: hypothetical protein CFH41_01565 [Alphaproteobacteria bacterium MarineAlpha11_Bin1]|tara:strand:+ start:4908 stop:5405 length:498 start_codon:yes stop_codon:yes gene_type:complete
MLSKKDKTNRPIEIKDLYFTEQAFIWALRMKVRGERYFERVRTEFGDNLPPSAKRIAIEAVNSTIRLVQAHGTKALKLNCTCIPHLSPDEWLLVRILREVSRDPAAPWPVSDSDFIAEDGRDGFVNALLSFQLALDLVDQRPNTEMPDRMETINQVHRSASITIH